MFLHEFGAISEYLCPEKRRIFRRINIEYLSLLHRRSPEEVTTTIWDGVRANLELLNRSAGDDKAVVSPSQLQEIARRAMQQTEVPETLRTLKITTPIPPLKGISQPLEALEKPPAHSGTAVSNELTRQAGRDIREAIAGDREHGKWLLIAAFKQLHKAIRLNPRNYKAHFDSAWLCSFFFRHPEKAAVHLQRAVQEAFEYHPPFTVFALRHLAEVRRDLQEYDAAVEAANEAYMLDRQQTPQIQFDLARYLTLARQNEKAAGYLEMLLREHPEYFWQVLAEPDFSDNPDVAGMMEAHSLQLLPPEYPGITELATAEEISETELAKTLAENRNINLHTSTPMKLEEMDPAFQGEAGEDENGDDAAEMANWGEAENDEEGDASAWEQEREDDVREADDDLAVSKDTAAADHGAFPAPAPEADAVSAAAERESPAETPADAHFQDLFVIDEAVPEASQPEPAPEPQQIVPAPKTGEEEQTTDDRASDSATTLPPERDETAERPATVEGQPTEASSLRSDQPESPPADAPSPGNEASLPSEEGPPENASARAAVAPPPSPEPRETENPADGIITDPSAQAGDVAEDGASGAAEASDAGEAPPAPGNVIIVKPPPRHPPASSQPPEEELAALPLQDVLSRIRRKYVEAPPEISETLGEAVSPELPEAEELLAMFDNFRITDAEIETEPPETVAADADEPENSGDTGETPPAVEDMPKEQPDAASILSRPGETAPAGADTGISRQLPEEEHLATAAENSEESEPPPPDTAEPRSDFSSAEVTADPEDESMVPVEWDEAETPQPERPAGQGEAAEPNHKENAAAPLDPAEESETAPEESGMPSAADDPELPHARELLDEVEHREPELSQTPPPHADGLPLPEAPVEDEILQLLEQIGNRLDHPEEETSFHPADTDVAFEISASPPPHSGDADRPATADVAPQEPPPEEENPFPADVELVFTDMEPPEESAPAEEESDDTDNLLRLIELAEAGSPALPQPLEERDAFDANADDSADLEERFDRIEANHPKTDDNSREVAAETALAPWEPPAEEHPRNNGVTHGEERDTPDAREQIRAEIQQEMELAKKRCEKLKSIFTRRDMERTQRRIEQIALDAIEKLPNIAEMDYPKYLRSTRRALTRQVEFFKARHRIISRLKRA